MKNREPEGNLPGKLRAWQVAPLVPPGFQREVWQRIAAREAGCEELIWPVKARPEGASPPDPSIGLSPGEDAV